MTKTEMERKMVMQVIKSSRVEEQHGSTIAGKSWISKEEASGTEDVCAVCVPRSCPLFEKPWTIALQAPLSMGILQTRILEWVAMLSSRESSQFKDQTRVSSTAGGFFTVWASREAQHNNLQKVTGSSRLEWVWLIIANTSRNFVPFVIYLRHTDNFK